MMRSMQKSVSFGTKCKTISLNLLVTWLQLRLTVTQAAAYTCEDLS